MVTRCVLRRKPIGGHWLETYLVDPQTKISSPKSYSLPRWDGRSPKIHGCCAQYTMTLVPTYPIHSLEWYGMPRKEFPHGDYRPRNTRPYRIWNLQDGNRALVAIIWITWSAHPLREVSFYCQKPFGHQTVTQTIHTKIPNQQQYKNHIYDDKRNVLDTTYSSRVALSRTTSQANEELESHEIYHSVNSLLHVQSDSPYSFGLAANWIKSVYTFAYTMCTPGRFAANVSNACFNNWL